MSKTYKLLPRDGNIPYQKIVTGRKWVGRVIKHATEQHWIGIIGKTTAKAASAAEAFDEVVAQHLGYASADALHNRNARVRHANRIANAAGDYLVGEFQRGNFAPLDKACETPIGASIALRAFTRNLKRDI